MAAESSRSGRVITFYSFKGGTGRTMALANVAAQLLGTSKDERKSRGKRILLVDWDLEAPGLWRYLEHVPKDSNDNENPGGLIDLLEDAGKWFVGRDRPVEGLAALEQEAKEAAEALDIQGRVVTFFDGQLSLLTAGSEASGYQGRIASFDWNSFHKRSPFFFRALADRWRREWDWTIVDSRTGFTDSSGICTAILPDVLVGVFVPNRQAIDGLVDQVSTALEWRRSIGDGGSLAFYPLPSRVDASNDKLRTAWRKGFETPPAGPTFEGYEKVFDRLFREGYSAHGVTTADYFNEVSIKHETDYAFGENVASLDDSSARDELSLFHAYRTFSLWIESNWKPWLPKQLNQALIELEQFRLRVGMAKSRQRKPSPKLLAKELSALLDELSAMDWVGRVEPEHKHILLDGIGEVFEKLLHPVDRSEIWERSLAPIAPALVKLTTAIISAVENQLLRPGARALQEQVLELHQRILGAEHPSTLTSMNNLALILGDEGDRTAARVLQEEVLEISRRLLGPEHPETLTSMNNLAATLGVQGDLAGARTLQEQVLESRRRVLGPEHLETLICMNNLAWTLRGQGDLTAARALNEQVLETRRRLLGSEHPDTLISLNNLAETLWDQGDTSVARALHAQVLDTRRRLVGLEHPDTLTSMNNLASTLWAQGDHEAARVLEEQVLETRRRRLGPEHPDTLTSMNNLASTLRAQGDLAAARVLQEQALEARRRLLGPEHPDTLTSMNNLASTLWDQGDLAAARVFEEQVLETRRRLLGPEHPSTLNSMNNLAETLRDQGDGATARALQQQVLETRRRLLGPEHPSTLNSMNNLAETLRDQGDRAAARALQEQVLETRRRVLGPEHPDTLASMGNLALILWEQGDLAAARAFEEQVLETRRRLLGPEHPDTLTSMSNLAETLRGQGDLAAARALQEQVLETRQRLLGPEHPRTRDALAMLLTTLKEAGETDEARNLLHSTADELDRAPDISASSKVDALGNIARMIWSLDEEASTKLIDRAGALIERFVDVEGAELIQAAETQIEKLFDDDFDVLGKKLLKEVNRLKRQFR